MTDTYNLAVNFSNLELNAPIVRARIEIRRSYLVDTFIVVPELKMDVVVEGEDFEVPLIPNTYGSFYEIVLWSEHTEELRCFFIMPAADTQLQNLELLTAYPNQLSGSSEPPGVHRFTDLYDTPNNYNDDAGKLVVVRNDQTGLEFKEALEATRVVVIKDGQTAETHINDLHETDEDLQEQIDTEESNRISADEFVNARVDTEITTRIAEIQRLENRLEIAEDDIDEIQRIIARDYIEIIVGTASPFVTQDLGGYVTRRTFILREDYPHIGACDTNGTVALALYRLTPTGISTAIGTVNYSNKTASFSFASPEIVFSEGDVLRVVATTMAQDCNRINMTLIAKFTPYDLDVVEA